MDLDLTNPDIIRNTLKSIKTYPNKRLGQHFLIHKPTFKIILDAGTLNINDAILEIGPGLGSLTAILASETAKVVAVERDIILAKALDERKLAKVEVIMGDILNFDLSQLPKNYKVVANIPYNLTSRLLKKLITSLNPPRLMVLLIQKEVAERICERPGNMSVLAFSVQYFADPKIIEVVERSKFWPMPKVDSAIIQIIRKPKPVFVADEKKLFRLIKAGFSAKRKKMKNSLAGGLNTSVTVAQSLLKIAQIDLNARAQELTMAQWHQLYLQADKQRLI